MMRAPYNPESRPSLSTLALCHDWACAGYRLAAKNGSSYEDLTKAKGMAKRWMKQWRDIARCNPGFNSEALKNASYWAGYYAGLHA